ncbi:MAG: DNA polymerase III subunit epsilon [Candidatus Competibacteraceae bacterium]
MRQIVLDTETTGLDPAQGHRIIEIGGVELVNRRLTGRRFQRYLQPDRPIEPAAVLIHGISTEFLADKPRFADITAELLEFISGTELIIHNAPFDIGFLEQELRQAGQAIRIRDICRVLDTLELARQRHPGQKNSLDALCKRYAIDNSQRSLHGALLDAEILADLYLAMTREQVTLGLSDSAVTRKQQTVSAGGRRPATRPPLIIRRATAAERLAHQDYLEQMERGGDGPCLWRTLTSDAHPIPDNTPDTTPQSEPPPVR